MKINIQTPGYAEAKTVIDAIVRPENFRHASLVAPEIGLTFFEIGRMAMALYLAQNLSINITEKVVRARYSAPAFQAFLDFHAVRNPSAFSQFKEPLGIKQLTGTYFSVGGGIPAFYGRRLPTIVYDKLRDELTDQGLGGRNEAFPAFIHIVEGALLDLKLRGIDTSGISVDEIRKNTKAQEHWPLSVQHFTSSFSLPGTDIQIQIHVRPYEKQREGELAGAIGSCLLYREQLIAINTHLSEAASAYSKVLSPTFLYQWSEGYGEVGNVYISMYHTDIDERLEECRRYTALNNLPVRDKSCEEVLQWIESPPISQKSAVITLEDTLRKAEKRRKRRLKLKSEIGAGIVLTDPVTLQVLDLVEKGTPDIRERAFAGKAGTVSLPVDLLETVSAGRPVKNNPGRKSKTLQVSFRLKESRLRTRIPLNADYVWSHDRLITPRIPETVLASLAGKDAREVFDHPFTQHLGKVVKARPIAGGKCEIVFDLPEKPVSVPSHS